MESLEIEHIKRNMKWLNQNTVCNSDLTEPLIAKGIITEEEAQRLEDLLERVGIYNAANEFYRILMENSEMVDMFLNLPLKMSGESKPFKEMFANFCRYDALAILKSAGMTKQELSKITTIKLEQELPKPRSLYIPRSISNRRKLDKKLFRVDSKDVFVFKGIDINTLEQFVEPHIVRLSSGQQSHVTSRHILLEDDEDWDYMSLVCKQPMHLIGEEDGEFVLLRSTKVTNTLSSRLLCQNNNKDAFVPENDFVTQILACKDGNGALLCDIPGIGKTWFMQHLALKIRAQANRSTTAVFYMDLLSLSTHLLTKKTTYDKDEALTTTLGFACNSKLAESFIHQQVQRGVLQVIFLLDGFDEISQKDVKSMISLLKNINEQRHVMLIITSRPSMRGELQETFNLVSFDIIPFDSSEQVKYITGLWKAKHSDVDNDTLRNLANQCVKSTKYIQRNDNREVFGVPLMCYILAENNEKFVEQVSRRCNKNPIQVPEIATITSVFDLYVTFVEKCFEKLSNKETREKILKFHTYKALDLIFPEISQCYLDASPELSFLKTDEILRPGVLKPGDERNFSFIHRSFADYMSAKLFTEIWTNVEVLEPSIKVQLQTFFVEHVLATQTSTMDYIKWIVEPEKNYFNFSYASLTGIQKIPVLPFQFTTVLWFLDNMVCNHGDIRSLVAVLESEVKTISSFTLHYSMENNMHLEVCRGSLRIYAFKIVLACLEERFTHICGLVAGIVKALFTSIEIDKLFTVPDCLFEDSSNKLTGLLYYAAASGSLETCNQVFSIFDGLHKNSLHQFCFEFPNKFYSPVEVAIDNNDFEMFSFFFSKVRVGEERLILRCLLGLTMSSTEIEARIKILKVVAGSDESFKVALKLGNIRNYFNSLSFSEVRNLHLLQNFSLKMNLSTYYLPWYCKMTVLRHAILHWNDTMLLNLVLCLFCKKRPVFLGYFNTATEDQTVSYNESETMKELNACEVLQAIDLTDTQDFPLQMNIIDKKHSRNTHQLESLKVLIGIFPDFTKCNLDGMNYLHLAAYWDKLDWIKYLVDMKYNINERDVFGGTPLHYSVLDPSINLQLTKILVESGAEVFVVDDDKRNVAHKIFALRNVEDDENFNAWVNYTLESGFAAIWSMEDSNGFTALELLIEKIGFQHPIVMSILRETNINVSVKIKWRHIICNCNDQQLLKQFLTEFPNKDSGVQNFINFKEEMVDVGSFKASEMLQQIQIDSAKHVVMQLGLWDVYEAFREICELETLKLFLGICDNFSSSNERKWNYMHCAVSQGNVGWLEYLLQVGHDIHQQDKFGCTPLLAMTWRNPVEMSRILVDNGADIYHVNECGENVANMILKLSIRSLEKELFDWLEYTLEAGYESLWDMVDHDEIMTKFQNIEIPIEIRTDTLLFIFCDDYRANLSQYQGLGNLDLYRWTKVVFAKKLNIQHVHSSYKIQLLHRAIQSYNDTQMIQLLLLLFPNYNSLTQELTNPQSPYHSTCFGVCHFQAETILALLNIIDAEQHFSKLNLRPLSKIFSNMKCLETLKVLTRLCSDLTQCTRKKVNYLHAAAIHGNICWAEYLIKAGYDVNQEDRDKDTPLLCISTKHATAVTKILIENGANPYALGKWNCNVAHKLLIGCGRTEECVVMEWVEYMRRQNYDSIWTVKDNLLYPGKTPYDILSKMLGADHPTTKSVYSQLGHTQEIFTWGENPYVQKYRNDFFVWSLEFESKWEYSDIKFVQELLKLFGRCAGVKCRYGQVNYANVDSKSQDSLQKAHNFLAEEILGCIDVKLAAQALFKVHLGNFFLENINSLETLKILITICPDFKLLNAQGGNYLHYAVRFGRVQWVDHLISVGYNVNERDKHGFTPVLCISPKNTFEIACLLFDNGCDAFVHDNMGENLLDKVGQLLAVFGLSIADIEDLVNHIKEKHFHNIVLTGTNEP